jgi:hypothetical protein
MSYEAQIFIVPIDNRQSERRPVNFAGTMRDHGALSHRVNVRDLSPEGCRLRNVPSLEIGAEIWLKLAGHLPLRAVIQWIEGSEAGCSFETQLSQGDLAILTNRGAHVPIKRLFSPPRQARR